MTRLVFQPTLIGNNPKDPDAQVRGVLRYQRKSKSDNWENIDTKSLKNVGIDEEVAITIRSGELKTLVAGISELNQLAGTHGIEMGNTKFIKVDDRIRSFLEITSNEFDNFLDSNVVDAGKMMLKVLKWASSAKGAENIINSLDKHSISSLEDVQAVASIRRLSDLIKECEANLANSNEGYWQRLLTENSHVFQLLFAFPVTLVNGGAYVGGKSINNRGANLADFLVKNSISENAAIVEIKTPCTKLLKNAYRNTYSLTEDLSGGISQVLMYKQEYIESYKGMVADDPLTPRAFDPECLLIIGNASLELDDLRKRKAFELFRVQMRKVKILTFDELLEKVRGLLAALRLGRQEDVADDSAPF